jgi:hypothetical protein
VAVNERKQVHESARKLLARRITELLDERDNNGKKKLTQAKLGQLLGVSQEAARRARDPNGVTPAIVNGMRRAFNINVLANERVETIRKNDDGTRTRTIAFPTLHFDDNDVFEGGQRDAATRVAVPSQEERRSGSLARVREQLYKRYAKPDVDEAIGGSDFIDAENLDELEAFQALDDILRMQHAEPKGKLQRAPKEAFDPDVPQRRGPSASSVPPGQRKAFRAEATKLSKGSAEPSGKGKRAGE